MLVNKKLKYIGISMGILIVINFIGTLYLFSLFNPVDKNFVEKIDIVIPKGSNTNQIAGILKNNDLIKSQLMFKMYSEFNHYDADLKAGKFALSKSMDLKSIMQTLIQGDAIIETTRFTIPEGFNVKQIADRLASLGLVNKDRFLQLVKEGNFDYEFLKQVPDNKNIGYRLEGYLFPDTYVVKKGATEEDIINKMLSQFQKEWNPEWDKVIKENNMTMHQIVTLASIVEREVVADKERPTVAGVFYNRLHDSWMLQSCATVQFVLGKQKDRLTDKDLEIKNPYNTYVNYGLPPGPIANPGFISIKASVFPAKTNYFFFVTKKDGSGEHYFSKTFQQHENYNLKSKGNW